MIPPLHTSSASLLSPAQLAEWRTSQRVLLAGFLGGIGLMLLVAAFLLLRPERHHVSAPSSRPSTPTVSKPAPFPIHSP